MWQYGILALDLLTNLSLSDRSNYFILWHHDVWPFVQKVLLHKDYMEYLMEDTFQNVFFNDLDFDLCHEFLEQILIIEPNVRASAAEVMKHEFVNVDWPQIPTSFGMPRQITAHPSKVRPKAMKKKPSDEGEDETEEAPLEESPSKIAEDILKKKKEKLQKEKQVRRQSLAAIAGKNPLMIRRNISGMDVEAGRSASQDLSTSDIDVRDNVVIKKSVEINKRNNTGQRRRNTKKVSIAPHKKLQAKVNRDPAKSTSSQLGRSNRSSTRQVDRFLSSSGKYVKGKSPVRKRSDSKDKSSSSRASRSPTVKKSPSDRKKSPTPKKPLDNKKSPGNSPSDEKSESNRGSSKSPPNKKSPTSPKSKTSPDDQENTSRISSSDDMTSSHKGANPKQNTSFDEQGVRKVSSHDRSHRNSDMAQGRTSPHDQKNKPGIKSAKDRMKSGTSSQKSSNPKSSTSFDEQGVRKVSSHDLSHQNQTTTPRQSDI